MKAIIRKGLFKLGLTRKVDTFIIGAQKAGTSSLHLALTSHPSIHGSSEPYSKELHYWNNSGLGPKNLYEYNSAFPFWLRNSDLQVDATPDYASTPGCIDRIYAYNPKAKFLFTLREPISRAYSAWKMFHYNHKPGYSWRGHQFHDPRSFDKAILEELKSTDSIKMEYLSKGYYASQIQELQSIIPPSQLKIIIVEEDLYPDPEKCLLEIQRFLQVPQKNLSLPRVNTSPDMNLSTEIHETLSDHFRIHNEKLREILRRDIPTWRE